MSLLFKKNLFFQRMGRLIDIFSILMNIITAVITYHLRPFNVINVQIQFDVSEEGKKTNDYHLMICLNMWTINYCQLYLHNKFAQLIVDSQQDYYKHRKLYTEMVPKRTFLAHRFYSSGEKINYFKYILFHDEQISLVLI